MFIQNLEHLPLKSPHHSLLAIATFFILTIYFIDSAQATTCAPNTSVSSNCDDLSLNGAGVVTIDAGVTISSVAGVAAVNTGESTSLSNAGTIQGNGGDGFHNNANLGTLNNTGTIKSNRMGGQYGVSNTSTITSLYNSGLLQGLNTGLYNRSGGTINTITNATGGLIGAGGAGLANDGTIGVLTNIGEIISAFTNKVNNAGVITTLNNLNNGNTLTYNGTLPVNYNVIINSPSNYGKISVSAIGVSATTFGVYTGSVVSRGTYASVLSGLTNENLTNLSGTYNGYVFTLSNSSGNIWDLVISGTSTVDTQISLVNTASSLQNIFTLANSALANSLSYDCTKFGGNGICISVGGRNTAVQVGDDLNNTNVLLIAAYRPHPNYRIGAYADQNLSMNNMGSTVNLDNNTPLIGLFGAYNEHFDGTGAEVKISVAYAQKNTTINRQVVDASEAGSGSSQLNSQGAQVIIKYGFGIADDVIVSPYTGVRYTKNNMGSYTEGTSSTVTAPLSYNAVNTNATTVLVGMSAAYRIIPQAVVFAIAGIESDANATNGTYSATGVAGLTAVNFNANPVKTRPTATVGTIYDLEKNQRLAITGIYRKEAYQGASTSAVMATYTVGW